MIYLDNAATTYPKPDSVYEALDYANRNLAFNAGRGSYKQAKEVADIVEETREKISALVGMQGSQVSFESSATEALNIIINGLDLKKGDTVYISPYEHNAVVRPLYNLKEKIGIEVKILPFEKETWRFEELKANDMFAIDKPKACFITHISNVTGYILPFGMIFALTKKYNCINILDCSQSLGVLNPSTDNTDFLVFAGHKSLYASFGIAGFINMSGIQLQISKSGGTGSDSLNPYMPVTGHSRYESGSINSIAIFALNRSLTWLSEVNVYRHEKEITDYLIDRLSGLKKINLLVAKEADVLGVVSFTIDGYSSQDVGDILSNEFDICVRTGYHCAPFVHDLIDSKVSGGTVRIGLGYFNDKNDIDILCEALESF